VPLQLHPPLQVNTIKAYIQQTEQAMARAQERMGESAPTVCLHTCCTLHCAPDYAHQLCCYASPSHLTCILLTLPHLCSTCAHSLP
jgi:hypothetical protein